MLGKLVLPEIRELIEAGDEPTLAEVVNRWLSADLAELVAALAPVERIRIFRLLQPGRAAETFEYLDLADQCEILDSLSDAESAEILNAMAPDDRTALLAELTPEQSERLIALLNPEQRAVARRLLDYREGSVGRLMTPDYVVVRKDWTMRHVLDHVRAHGRDSETLNVIYVVDDQNKLVDDLRIREVLLAPLHTRVADVMDGQCVNLRVTDDAQTAIQIFRKYDRSALPVVDPHGRMAGIVTLDDVLDLAEEQATQELQRFGGLEALDDPYLSTSLPAMIRKLRFLAGHPVRRRDVDGHGHGPLRGRARAGGGPGLVHPADHLQRRELRLAGSYPDHPGPGPRRGQAPRLVASPAPRDPGRIDARSHSWLYRIPSDRGLERRVRRLRKALDSPGIHRRRRSARSRHLGNLDGLHAPVPSETPGIRPGHLLSPICRHPGRRHRADHLFQRGHGRPAWDCAIKQRPAPSRDLSLRQPFREPRQPCRLEFMHSIVNAPQRKGGLRG